MKKSLFESEAQRRGGVTTVEPQRFVYGDGAPSAASVPVMGTPRAAAVTEDEARRREQQARREEQESLAQAMENEVARRIETGLAAERAAMQRALAEFLDTQKSYFLRLEREVVQLALAIARKILHREAQVDPLLLAGAVRAALDQLAAGCEVEVAIPPSSLAAWQTLLDSTAAKPASLLVKGDPALEPAGCRVMTTAGSCELGLETQIENVEQAMLGLLARRTALVRAPAA